MNCIVHSNTTKRRAIVQFTGDRNISANTHIQIMTSSNQRQLLNDTPSNTPGLWQQVLEREDYPTITNQRETSISIAPRHYTIRLTRLAGEKHIDAEQIDSVKNIARRVHNYSYPHTTTTHRNLCDRWIQVSNSWGMGMGKLSTSS